jgi:hypothetical protein
VSEQRTFDKISPELWQRMVEHGQRAHGTVFEPEQGEQGVATTRTPIGIIALSYTLHEGQDSVTYRIERKPFLVSSAQIWSGLESAIERCRRES